MMLFVVSTKSSNLLSTYKEEIRSRKQKPNESFDVFFEAVSSIMDKLSRPMSEQELIGILARNLRPDIRQDLLYVPIHSLSHLRKLVQMRENFLNDEYVRKNLTTRNASSNLAPKRYVADIDNGLDDNFDTPESNEHVVEAFHKPLISKCWNCQDTGHHWQDCLEERTIFCYGCGASNIYKPNCVKCAARKSSASKNLIATGPQRDQV